MKYLKISYHFCHLLYSKTNFHCKQTCSFNSKNMERMRSSCSITTGAWSLVIHSVIMSTLWKTIEQGLSLFVVGATQEGSKLVCRYSHHTLATAGERPFLASHHHHWPVFPWSIINCNVIAPRNLFSMAPAKLWLLRRRL